MTRMGFRLLPLALACGLLMPVSAQRGGPAPDPLVKENATVKVAPHTYIIADDNVPLVPNVGIVVGSEATLVIDPGLGRRNGEAILREVAKISRTNRLYIATTHYHPEHTTGYVAFPATATYVNSRTQEAEFGENGAQMIRAFAGRSPLTADLLKDAERRMPAITFDKEYGIHLGDVDVRLLMVGPTHTKGDTVAFVAGDNVLFTGDVVMNNSFLAATAASSMKAWLAAFDALDGMKASVIVPSHGASGTGALVGANRDVMRGIRDRAVTLKSQGKTVDETAAAVQTEVQALHPSWPRATGIGPAARSAYQEAP